jgi:hypothetical protein
MYWTVGFPMRRRQSGQRDLRTWADFLFQFVLTEFHIVGVPAIGCRDDFWVHSKMLGKIARLWRAKIGTPGALEKERRQGVAAEPVKLSATAIMLLRCQRAISVR